MSETRFSHVDVGGEATMVDVGGKAETERIARARAYVRMQATTLQMILEGRHHKGDVFATARIAGIQAAKRTWELIPLCHPLPITRVTVEFSLDGEANCVDCTARVETRGQTGVEMEALTAVTTALLTVYDMAKAIDRGMTIECVRLLAKSGGKSGDWVAEPQ